MPATHTPHFDRVHFSASSSDISLSGEIGAHRNSSESDCLSEVDLESGALDMEVHSDNKTQRDCRICHLGLETSEQECGGAIELGCSCKGDLGAAHKKCAETWFKIKGNTWVKTNFSIFFLLKKFIFRCWISLFVRKSEYPCDGFEELYIMVVRKCF